MRLEYSERSDKIYVVVGEDIVDGGVVYTENVSPGRQYARGIDRDADDRILGYELLNVSRGVDVDGLPHAEELAALFAERGIRVLVKGPSTD